MNQNKNFDGDRSVNHTCEAESDLDDDSDSYDFDNDTIVKLSWSKSDLGLQVCLRATLHTDIIQSPFHGKLLAQRLYKQSDTRYKYITNNLLILVQCNECAKPMN